MSLDYTNENSDDLKKTPVGRTVAIVVLGCAVMVGLASVGYKLVRGASLPKEEASPVVFSEETGESKGFFSFFTDWFKSEKPQITFVEPIELRLDAIVTDPLRVMINRKLVVTGESIDGAQVVEITATQVNIEFQGKSYSLKVGETLRVNKEQ